MPPFDEDLIKLCLAGKLEAFDALMLRWQGKILNLAYHYLGNAEDARDVCQDVFLRALSSLKRYRPGTSFPAWLYRIALAGIAVAAAALVMAVLGTQVRYADGRLTVTVWLRREDGGPAMADARMKEWVRTECLRQTASSADLLASRIEALRRQQNERLLDLAEIVEAEVNTDLASLGTRIRRFERSTAADLLRTNTAMDNLMVAVLGTIEASADTETQGGEPRTTNN